MFFDEDPLSSLSVLTAARLFKHSCTILDALSLQRVIRRYGNLGKGSKNSELGMPRWDFRRLYRRLGPSTEFRRVD